MNRAVDVFDEFRNNPDVIWIGLSSPGDFITTDPVTAGRKIQDVLIENAHLIFEYAHEGQIVPYVHKIYQILKHVQIAHSKVYFITSGPEGKKLHDIYCEQFGITDPIHVYIISMWELNVHNANFEHCYYFDATKEEVFNAQSKDKVFLCFNRIFRLHRAAIIGLLSNRNLLDKGYNSFSLTVYTANSFTMGEHATLEGELIDHLNDLKRHVTIFTYEKIKDGFQKTTLPLLLNSNPHHNTNYLQESDIPLFRKSHFSLVTETHFFPYERLRNMYYMHEVFFSEKTFKPIVMKHPFIMVAPAKSLEYLRARGYQTFAPYINEMYDTIEDHEQRLLAVVDEVERLSKQTPEEWEAWELNVAPIIEHNYNVIKNRKYPDDFIVERA